MSYASLDDLARVAVNGWQEVAERVCPDARVDGLLLQAVAAGGDTYDWDEDVVALAVAGVALARDGLERASRHADSYLAPRYVLPLPAAAVAGTDLPTVVATLALRRLYSYAATDEMLRASRWAETYLQDLAAGRASLGAAAAAAGEEGEVYFAFSPRGVTDDDLRGFG